MDPCELMFLCFFGAGTRSTGQSGKHATELLKLGSAGSRALKAT